MQKNRRMLANVQSIFRRRDKNNKGPHFTYFLKQAMVEKPLLKFVPACTRAGVHTSVLIHETMRERCYSLTRVSDTNCQNTVAKLKSEIVR